MATPRTTPRASSPAPAQHTLHDLFVVSVLSGLVVALILEARR